ncbi:MAG: hypothetical protein L6R37_000588 [Teloschistes peruensis]|nr:MAG: hypothetical protein L6R37_000588 [Teloschistes peruensis]
MTRKKRPAPKPKRVEITDSDGWTHIIKGLKNTHLTAPSPSSNGTKIQPASIPSGQTLTDLQETHAHYRSQWLPSPSHDQIRNLFVREILPSLHGPAAHEKQRIDRCIILGLGSLSNGHRSSWWELVFLETVLFLLRPPASDGEGAALIETMIQDPVLNAMDHTFFSSLGYTVLADPLAFDEITESTLLFAPHLELNVYAEALRKAQPMMCVGTDVKEYIDKVDWRSGEGRKESEEAERVDVFQRYMDATHSWPLPEFERDHWMCFTCIYSKKPNDADQDYRIQQHQHHF